MACPAGYLCRAEFVKADKAGIVSLGDTISLAKVDALGRSKKEPTKPWVNGEFIPEKSQPGKATFEFNKDRKGWHYGWASNKHTCNAKHCLLTYVLEPISKDMLRCVHVIKSTPFMVRQWRLHQAGCNSRNLEDWKGKKALGIADVKLYFWCYVFMSLLCDFCFYGLDFYGLMVWGVLSSGGPGYSLSVRFLLIYMSILLELG